MEGNGNREKLIKRLLVILLLLNVGMIVYLCYDKVFTSNKDEATEVEKKKDNENKEANEEEKIEQSGSNENNQQKDQNVPCTPTAPVAKCYGTYYGEYHNTESNGLTVNYNYTYALNKDGTFSAKFGDTSSTTGTFTINDNTITFIRRKDTAGPRDETPYYYSEDFLIADDCSYILYDNQNGERFKLFKQ